MKETSPRACRYCEGTGFIEILSGGLTGKPVRRKVRCTHKRGGFERSS